MFSEIAKSEILEVSHNLASVQEFITYQGRFTESVYFDSMIGKTLKLLQEYHIIRKYSEQINGDVIEISFEYSTPELAEVLYEFEEKQCKNVEIYRSLKFIPLNGGLKIANRFVKDIQLYKNDESQEQIAIKRGFMQEISNRGYVLKLHIKEDGTMSFAFKDEATMHLFKNQGAIFELIVYFYMCESGLFDDVETGVKIAWDAEEIEPEQLLLDELSLIGDGQVGYSIYRAKRQEVLRLFESKQTQSVMNEVDVIGISGMSGIMVSCKTSDKDTMQWIYEIKAVADHFQSSGVMAISSDFSNKSRSVFKARAREMKVSLWGTETLWNQELRRKAFQEIVKQAKK